MDDIFVARVMSHNVYTISSDTLVEDAATTMLDEEIGSMVVVDEQNQLQGILTTTDFVRIVSERKPKDQTPVSAYMSSDVVTTSAQTSICEVADTMIEHGFHHMPVIDEESGVIGMVTTTDLAGYVSDIQRPEIV